jgi:hypothetical protein
VLVSIAAKYAVSQVVGFIKGKSVIHLGRSCLGAARTTLGCNSELGDISFQASVAIRRRSASISKSRRKKALGLINWDYSRRIDGR